MSAPPIGALEAALREARDASRKLLVPYVTGGLDGWLGVVRAIARTEGLRLDGIVTVVDASRLSRLSQHDLALEQIAYADVLVLSRADACDDQMLCSARTMLSSRNAVALITHAEHGALCDSDDGSLDALLARRDATERPLRLAPAPSAGHGIESVSLTHCDDLDEERFLDWVEEELARFEGRLLRIKGVLAIRGVDTRVVLQGVAGDAEVELGSAWGEARRESRLVLIGFGLDRDALAAGFSACAAQD